MPRWSASGPVPGGVYPYLWVDATFVKGRLDGRVVSLAVVVAVGVRAGARGAGGGCRSQRGRRVLGGVSARPGGAGVGVQLVTSDAHEGCARPSGPCCTARSGSAVALQRNALSLVPKAAQQLVAATIRTVFAQPTAEAARQQWRQVADSFRVRWPRLAAAGLLMDDAEADVLAYLGFPAAHWRQIWSTNPWSG